MPVRPCAVNESADGNSRRYVFLGRTTEKRATSGGIVNGGYYRIKTLESDDEPDSQEHEHCGPWASREINEPSPSRPNSKPDKPESGWAVYFDNRQVGIKLLRLIEFAIEVGFAGGTSVERLFRCPELHQHCFAEASSAVWRRVLYFLAEADGKS